MYGKVLQIFKKARNKNNLFFLKWIYQTKERQEWYENRQICYISKEKFKNKYLKNKKYCKVRDHCHYTNEYGGAVHSICNLK